MIVDVGETISGLIAAFCANVFALSISLANCASFSPTKSPPYKSANVLDRSPLPKATISRSLVSAKEPSAIVSKTV